MSVSDQSGEIRQAAIETEQLFSEYSASLVRYLRTGLRDASEIEDLAQETFIRYFQARSNGEQIENPKGWLYPRRPPAGGGPSQEGEAGSA